MNQKKRPPVVAAIEGTHIYITGGLDYGMQVGDRVEIMKPARKIVHPVTKEDHGEYHTVVATGVITHVMQKAAVVLRDTPNTLIANMFGWGPPPKAEKKDPKDDIEIGDIVGKRPEQPKKDAEEKKLSDTDHQKRAVAAASRLEEEDEDDDDGY